MMSQSVGIIMSVPNYTALSACR